MLSRGARPSEVVDLDVAFIRELFQGFVIESDRASSGCRLATQSGRI